MNTKEYDILVIGGGIAGYYSSRYLAKAGKRVALVEKDKLGGVALRWGALPVKKALDFLKKNRYENLKDIWDKEIAKLENWIMKNIKSENIDIFFGEGEFINSKTYRVGDNDLTGEYIIIATGTEASGIDGITTDKDRIITHKEAVDFKSIPKDIIILGGNVEGVEFAAIYGEQGSNVTIIEKESQLLVGNDADLVYPIEKHLIEKGVSIIKGVGAKRAFIDGNKVKIELDNGKIIEGEKALVTLSRKPNFPKGIERLNINIEHDRILVDENLKTGEDHIFAIGDINGIVGMAHAAINQGIGVAEYICNKTPVPKHYILPRAVFTLPEMAGVGKQEWELKNVSYKVCKYEFKDTWRGWSKGIEEGFVKVLVDEDGIVLGIWMVGEDVSEYIGFLSILGENKLTVSDIKSNLIIHPSLTEALLEALMS